MHFEGALFEIDSSAFTFQLQSLLSLRVVGQTRLGHSVTVPMGWVDRWAKFPHETGLHRYGNRDMAHCLGTSQPCNGDAWSYPDVISFLDVATSAGEFQIDDISNMNGGWFPTHASHQFGLDIDAYFSGYQDRTKAIAIKLVGILRKHETKIGSILVTMTTAMRRHFESEPPLSDGSAVSSKFINASGHSGHFHVRLKSKEFQ